MVLVHRNSPPSILCCSLRYDLKPWITSAIIPTKGIAYRRGHHLRSLVIHLLGPICLGHDVGIKTDTGHQLLWNTTECSRDVQEHMLL